MSIEVFLHNLKCGVIERWEEFQADQKMAHARTRVEEKAAALRARLAAEREHTFDIPGLAEMRRRLANLTFPIAEARRLAAARFESDKKETMDRLQELLSTGEPYSLRDLAGLLHKAPNTIRRYQAELAAKGWAGKDQRPPHEP